jgi:hypothetical protein
LHAENETRMLGLTVPDDPQLTRQIMRAIARRREDTVDEMPPESWSALQRWLELAGERRVVDEDGFLLVLAEVIPTVAVRLRRVFALVRSLIFAHAILHQATRPRDAEGRIVATLDDYEAVRRLIAAIVAEGIGASVPDDVRDTVAAVAAALGSSAGEVVRRAQVRAELGIDDRATNRRLSQAVEAGFVENTNPGRGKVGLYKLGQPIPDDIEVLPTVDALRCDLDDLDNQARGPSSAPPPPPQNVDVDEAETLAELERLTSDRCHFCQRERDDLVQSSRDPAMWWCPRGDVDCSFHARLRLGVPLRIAQAARARELEELHRRKETPAS